MKIVDILLVCTIATLYFPKKGLNVRKKKYPKSVQSYRRFNKDLGFLGGEEQMRISNKNSVMCEKSKLLW